MTKLSILSLGSIRRVLTPDSLAPDTVFYVITWREAHIDSIDRSWTGCVEATAKLTSPIPGRDEITSRATCKVLAYTELVGNPQLGDRVLLNVSALARGLGTGGFALVVAIPDRLPPDPEPGPGHLVKARYTPLQPMVLGVDEQESGYHGLLQTADDLAGMPVVTADLHSALPAIIAGVRNECAVQGIRIPTIAYVMTDGAALPLWFSRSVDELKNADWLAGTVTVGQAFGGDLEAVTIHTGMLAAKEILDAEITIVAQGPGNLGTGTRWGYSGVSAGEAINAAATLGGHPIGSLRISGADARERHLGISHHSTTAYGRVALTPADIVTPRFSSSDIRSTIPDAPTPDRLITTVERQADEFFSQTPRHRRIDIDTDGLRDALNRCPVRLSTMGRNLEADPSGFIAAAAAGVHAVRSLLVTR